MTTVEIDIEQIGAAITALETLSSAIDSQSHNATRATPIALPTLSSGTLGKMSQWLKDHLEDLETRRDLAIILDKEGTGAASYTVASDTLRNVQDLLGTELANAVDDLGEDPDQADVERISGLLANWQNDPEVMAAMYEELGPDGTVGALSRLSATMRFGGIPKEELDTLVEQLRTGLSTASDAPGFPAEWFGREVVRYSTAPLLSREEQDAFDEKYGIGMTGANILTFLMQDTTYSDGFLLGAGRELDGFEQMMSKDGMMTASDWYNFNGHGPLDTGEFDGWHDDPMAAIMDNFGENPQAGLTFFTEAPERQTFYFNDRTWEADGYAGISHAVDGIGTDAANLHGDPEATTTLVSAFLDQVANSEGFNPDDATAASPHIANLLKFYMPAVDTALRSDTPDGDPASTSLTIEHYGTFEFYPVLYKGDLDSLMQVAMSTQDGTQSIAEGIGAYQGTQMNNISAELALDPDDPSLRNELRTVLGNTAALQGFGEYSVGQVEIDGAVSRDAQRRAFIDLVGDAAGLVPLPGADQVGELGSTLIGFGVDQTIDLGKDAAGNAFTSETEAVTDEAEGRAQAGATRLKLDSYVALIEAGIIPREEVPDHWYENGRLIDTAGIAPEELGSRVQEAMAGVNDFASDFDIEGPYKNEFLKYYGSAS